jgi:methyl-accepting chemotaxis protein
VIDENAAIVAGELEQIATQVVTVREAATTIDTSVAAVDEVTRAVVEQAGNADRVVEGLENSLRRVAETAELIARVAGQTRLLALNATIEAVRAGAAGKGFTVVAGEVKALASATASSTDQITSTVESLERDARAMATALTNMTAGVGEVDRANSMLREIATGQHGLVEQLGSGVGRAIARIRNMAGLTDGLERRRFARAPSGNTAIIRIGTRECPVRVLDLSTGGLRCVGALGTLPIDQTVEVILPLAEGPLTVRARVVYQDASSAEEVAGLAFIGLDPQATGTLEVYVASLLEADESA